MRSEQLQIIYVMGAGRSGSTILGVLLGNCPSTFYAGELDAWLARSGVPNFDGERRERFWNQILCEMGNVNDLFGSSPRRQIEHSLNVFRIARGAAMRRRQVKYRKVAQRLYVTIARNADALRIVDTSHFPLRARQLQHVDGIDLHLVYLVRSPVDVISAFGRKEVNQPSKSWLAAALYIGLTTFVSVGVFLRQPRERRLLVVYEDLLAEPSVILAKLLANLGAPRSQPDLDHLETGLAFQGNRLLRSDSVTFARRPRNGDRRSVIACLSPWRLLPIFLRPSARV